MADKDCLWDQSMSVGWTFSQGICLVPRRAHASQFFLKPSPNTPQISGVSAAFHLLPSSSPPLAQALLRVRVPCAIKSRYIYLYLPEDPTHTFLSIKPAPEPGTSKLTRGLPGWQAQGEEYE